MTRNNYKLVCFEHTCMYNINFRRFTETSTFKASFDTYGNLTIPLDNRFRKAKLNFFTHLKRTWCKICIVNWTIQVTKQRNVSKRKWAHCRFSQLRRRQFRPKESYRIVVVIYWNGKSELDINVTKNKKKREVIDRGVKCPGNRRTYNLEFAIAIDCHQLRRTLTRFVLRQSPQLPRHCNYYLLQNKRRLCPIAYKPYMD